MNNRDKNSIVITGIGVVSPCGIGKKRFWDFLKKGKSAIGPITEFDTSELKFKIAGEVKDFDIRHLLKTKGLRNLTRSSEFALAGAKLAFDDAKLSYPLKGIIADSCGVCLGISAGSTHGVMAFHKGILTEGPRFVDPLLFSNVTPNAIASHISIKFNIRGFNTTISSAYSTAIHAISYAKTMIKDYNYKIALAGSVEELSWEVLAGLIKLRCLPPITSKKNPPISCPYDKRRSGIIPGEGACIFVIEDLEHAKKRGAKIYTELKGCGLSFDRRTKFGFSPDAKGQIEAMAQALAEFGYPNSNIDFIAGCANSTIGCDYTEAYAIRKIFKERTSNIPVTSIKSIIGESFSAGGSFNIAAAIGSLEEDFIPPTINYRFVDKRCDLNIVANDAIRKKSNNILINAFSHSGLNGALVIGRTNF